ncbi:DUF1178 family protein [Paralcaligenes sp. KSB-10]|jgi:hypothetical protein|uniref:DUF1178 family protein n=1 Tax=Paralcaligenes sp. KSB-10 TaxID=2901142 RepID=UPI001E559DBF|nr:DUF1178 family protein [Paralcaligenes sp. KSB-10]UHL66009.1 DUF1178 family protein [Paralcaligenes sp. KSB-10]
MTLKVFDLQCESGHIFEGWFGSLDNYESQRSRGLLTCPVCGSGQVNKKLSAPRLNVGHPPDPAERPAASMASNAVAAPASRQLAQLQAEVMRQIRQMVRNTENVGEQFAREARRMHEGEVEERAIRGTATIEERESLAQDGIVVMPIPDYLDDDRLQ